MKQTLLIALLGATVTLTTPSLSFADNSYGFKSDTHNLKHQKHKWVKRHHRQHKNDHKRITVKPAKPKYTKKKPIKKHHVVKQVHKPYKHKKHNKPSFSITLNTGGPVFAYGNLPRHHGYRKPHRPKYVNYASPIYKRIHQQAKRIQHGIRSGQLVNREVRRLQQEQGHIKHTLAQYKRDGRINRHESYKLNHLLDISDNNIYQKSNNHRTRYSQRHKQNAYNNYNYVVQF